MKIAPIYSASLAGLLLAAQTLAATDAATGWKAELNVVQVAANQDSAGRTRDEAILTVVVDAARNGLKFEAKTIQTAEWMPAGANPDAAAVQAAYSAMTVLYPSNGPILDAWLMQSLAELNDSASAIAAGRQWGEHVAQVTLAEPSEAVAFNRDTFAVDLKATAASASSLEIPAAPSAVQASTRPDGQVVTSAEQAPIGPGRYYFAVLAGAPGTRGYVDAAGSAARFNNPGGIAVDAAGNVFVSEQDMATIRKISPDGTVTTFAGAAGQMGSLDGAGPAARFFQPMGLAVDVAGNLFVADCGNGTIRKIDPSGNVTTLTGTARIQGDVDGASGSAELYYPSYLALDAAGNLFVTQDASSLGNLPGPHALVRQVAPDGTVSSPAFPSVAGLSYYGPEQICVDRAGSVYVSVVPHVAGALWDDREVLRLTPTGETGKYAASALEPPGGYYGDVIGISLDQNGSLMIRSWGDPFNVYTPNSGWQKLYPGVMPDLVSIKQVVVGKSGELYSIPMSDSYHIGAVELGVFDPTALGPVLLSEPGDLRVRPGDEAGFFVTAAGGPALTFQWYFDATPINGATTSFLTVRNVRDADAGSHYSVVVSDGAGSVTSRKADLALGPVPSSGAGSATSGTSSSGTGTSTSTSGSGTGASGTGSSDSGGGSGGGSLDPRSSLLALLLLAVRKLRHRQRATPAARSE